MDCLICYEPGKIVVCNTCDYSSCEKCLSRYFEAVVEPCCPNCKSVWDQLFLSTFSSKLYSSCIKLKAKFFLDSELVLLPLTQELATREQEAREILKNIEETRLIVMENREKFYRTQRHILRTTDTVKLAILHRNRDILYKKAFSCKKSFRVDDALDIAQKLRDMSGRVVRNYNVIFCKCPADMCRGYIEYSTMECGFCRVKVCKICTSSLKLGEEHKCKEEEIASAEAIRKDTKPCPKCSSPIFKIEGCDQMWCTQCHFAFSWNTGEEDGDVVVHNPHFYEWQRQQNNGVAP